MGLAVICLADSPTNLPSQSATNVSYSPAVLPGKGLAQHPFLYTGEWDYRDNRDQTIFLVRDGKVVWTYSIPIKDADGTLQELGDATMLANGNIVFCRKVGASEVTPAKKSSGTWMRPRARRFIPFSQSALIECSSHKTAIRRS